MQPERSIATILFTDIVGSTERAARLGDQRWRELLEQHHEIVRAALGRFGGEEIATAGDGFFALFDRPTLAIGCANALRNDVREIGIDVRCGLHMGAVGRDVKDDASGIAVHVGARVAAEAKTGEILVTNGVRDAELGTGIEFADRGRRELKGLPGEWRLFAVTAVPAAAGASRPRPQWLERARERLAAGAIGLALILGLAGAYVVVQDRGRSFSPSPAMAEAHPGMAVLPFSVRGQDLDIWREGMMDLLSTGLDHTPGLRAISTRTVMARWDEHVSQDQAADLPTVLDVARASGARYAVVGSAVAIGPAVRLVVDIYDAADGERLGQGQVEGAPDSVLMLIDRLAVDAVRIVLQEGEEKLPQIDLATLTSPSPEALRAYLEGEVHYRHFDLGMAEGAFKRAVEADSTFALAHYRLAGVYAWGQTADRDLQAEHLEYALRFVDRLPERESIFVRAMHDEIQGSLDSVPRLLEAVRAYPDDAEAWYRLGETYVHVRSALASAEEMDKAFGRAVELDPRSAQYLRHHVEFAWWHNPDGVQAARLSEIYEQLATDYPLISSGRQFALDLAFGDSVTQGKAMARLRTEDLDVVTQIVFLLYHPRYAGYRTAYRELYQRGDEVQKLGAAYRLFGDYALWRGRLQESLRYLDDPALPVLYRTGGTYWAFALGLPIPEDRLMKEFNPALIDSITEDRVVFYAGAFAADRGRWSDHARAVAELERRAESPWAAGSAKALEGYALWRNGQPAAALSFLEDPQSRFFLIGKWWLGGVYQELGRLQDAEHVYRAYGMSQALSIEPLAQRELGRIYEQLGEYDKARESYEYFVEYWQDADPELQPMVEEARQAIIRCRGRGRTSVPRRPDGDDAAGRAT